MDTKDYDLFNLITQAQIGVSWIFESTVVKNAQVEQLNEVLNEFKLNNGNIDIFNQGTALMYAYISFLLPKESIFSQINTNNINISGFNIIQGNKKDIFRRLRNSLAHGYIEVKNKAYFVFRDKRNKEPFDFEVEITFQEFGQFVQEFYNNLKKLYFKNTEPTTA